MPRNIVVIRIFDAPVEQVWNAWVDPDHVMRWWGPTGFTSPVAKMDVRDGGTSLICMRSPQGQDFYNTWAYSEVVPLQRLEFVMNFADATGTRVAPTDLGLPPLVPQDVRHVVTFTATAPDKTEMTVTEFGYTSDEQFDMSKAGLEQCLDKMAASFTATA